MKKFWVSCIILFISFRLSAQTYFEKENVISDAEKVYGLSKFWSEVKYNFTYYNNISFDWDSLYVATIPKVLATTNQFEYYRELKRMAALLNDGHTDITMSYQSYAKYWNTVPISTKLIEGKVLISDVLNDSLQQSGLIKGLEIVKINGEEVHAYAQRNVIPYVSASTPQFRLARAYNRELLKGKKDELLNLTLKNNKGEIFDKSISRYTPEKQNRKPLIVFKNLDNNIGYLKIRAFWDNEFYGLFDEAYNDVLLTNGLIIDLRGNAGGNTNFALYVLKHLTTEKFKTNPWSSPMFIAAHTSWNYPQEWYTQSASDIYPFNDREIYTKPVIVLVDEETYSTAEDFTSIFSTMKRGKIIGMPTAGSTGNIYNFEMPEGGYAIICTKTDTYPDGKSFVGIGIIPDIEMGNTVEAFLTDKDICLERAIVELTK